MKQENRGTDKGNHKGSRKNIGKSVRRNEKQNNEKQNNEKQNNEKQNNEKLNNELQNNKKGVRGDIKKYEGKVIQKSVEKNRKWSDNKDTKTGTEHSIKSNDTKDTVKRYKKSDDARTFVKRKVSPCPYVRKCGECHYMEMSYQESLLEKQKWIEKLLKNYCKISPIVEMENPIHYRNKVHAVFGYEKGQVVSGIYKNHLIPIDSCFIENQKANEIIITIRELLKSFKIKTYKENTGYGEFRHVLVKRGVATGEIMVVLVTAFSIFPSKNNFVKALLKKHPEITTIIHNINGNVTNMVLGNRENVMYGKGYIEDKICGVTLSITSKSYYQVNPVQAEKLYEKAISLAELTGKELVIDAYSGIGTIGLIASKKAKQVIGVDLNKEAVKGAITNAKKNQICNARFFCADVGDFMASMAKEEQKADVVFMDPPRNGSTEQFIDSVAVMKPSKVIYISYGSESLDRDLKYFRKKGFEVKRIEVFDLYPWTNRVEVVIQMTYCGDKRK